ncbi:FAD-dependent oxidoreductase [Chloroflexota bacterium]
MTRLKMLFQPIKVGQVELKNRIICLAMGAGMKICDGELTPQLINFYAARVSGGASSVFLPLVAKYPGADFNQMMPGAYEDKFMPGMRAMVKAIHAQDAKAGAQMFMMDDQYARGRGAPTEVVGPSDIPKPRSPIPRPLTMEEIEEVIDSYAESAKRSRDAGFDMVEFHFGIGFLVAKFISPLTNNRTDQYGGSLEKRMKLPLDIIAAVKKRAGNDYPISIRFAADELIEGGHTAEDGKEVARFFEKAGVHMLNVQPGWTESPVPMVQMSVPRGHWVYLAEGVKKVVKVSVIACTRINDPTMSEEILTSGKADLIGMGRPLLADPELPNKAKKGRFEDIRTCIACCYCMDRPHADMRNVLSNLPVLCSINAQCGREGIYTIERASKPKRIAVVGGGPAGLEAARVAALRGHRVTLYEKDNKLGGLLNIAKIPPHKEELVGLINHLVHQVENNGVRIKLGGEFTESTLERDKPEAVILATGSVPLVPEIAGAENSNVVGFADVLTNAREVGDRVVIVGGGMVGCETAEFLHAKGKQVTILEMLPRVGDDIGVTNRFAIMGRLREAGIRMRANTKAARITEEGVEATHDGATEFLEGDTVVLATGMKAKNELAKKLEHKIGVLYSIGDCAEPHRIVEAIENGFRIASQI